MWHDERPIAAIDIGSNTLHLIVARPGAEPHALTILERRVSLARFGADIHATGAIGPERAARAAVELREMADLARAHGVTTLIALATEGVRAASNADEILARCAAALGAPVTLISGLEEAALTYWGASSDAPAPGERHAVGDLGGGSCELVIGAGDEIDWARSLPLGSGRLLDDLQPGDPPTASDFAALGAAATERLRGFTFPPPAPTTLLAVGGTAASISRLSHGDDRPRVLTLADLERARAALVASSAAVIATQRSIEAERARLLVAGVAAWGAILAWLGLDALRVSHRGVREGAIIAWRLAGDDWQSLAGQAAPRP